MSLKKQLGLNELMNSCVVLLFMLSLFFLIILVCQNLLSDIIQRCSLYRDRKDGATTIASPRGPRRKITLYYQMMNSLKVTLHRMVTFF